MSLRPRADLSQFRYMDVSSYHVKPGKGKEWAEVVKMVKAAYEKGVPDVHWGVFEMMYGGEGGMYLVLSGHKSLAEIDQSFAQGKRFRRRWEKRG